MRLSSAAPGTLADEPLAPVTGDDARTIRFAIGGLAAGEVVELRFRTRVGAGAIDGGAVNRAWAYAPGVGSNTATATVELVAGPFAPEGTILGTVFVDADGDGRPGRGEPALPGVRLYLDDGTFAVTDADGRYSLYGIAPRTHALKLDRTTLPAGARPVATDARDAGTPGLRFVDLTNGDAQRADFAIAADSALVAGRARARARRWRSWVAASSTARSRAAPRAWRRCGRRPTRARFRPRASRPARRACRCSPARPRRWRPPGARTRTRATARSRRGSPRSMPTPGFVDFAPLDTVGATQVDVRVKGPFGALFGLAVNGVPVPATRVGRKVGVERGRRRGLGVRRRGASSPAPTSWCSRARADARPRSSRRCA